MPRAGRWLGQARGSGRASLTTYRICLWIGHPIIAFRGDNREERSEQVANETGGEMK